MASYQQGVPIRINDTFRVAGAETNPTAITWTILGPDGTVTTYQWPGDPEVTQVDVGVFYLSLSPPSLPGEYSYDVDATGAVVASRTGSFTILPNVATGSDVPWAVVGPCVPWVSSQDVWNCCGQPMETDDSGDPCRVDFTAYAIAASQVLYELSGRLYSGACEQTVRPCGEELCGFQVLSRGHIVGWEGSYWGRNAIQACGCNPLDSVLLAGYPVREITEVKIDGVVVDPTTYRIDDRRNLTRIRDPLDPDTPLFWPSCQLMDLDDDQEGTFSVTYRYGQDPPLVGQDAAAELACELYKACSNSGDCGLPSGTTRVIRQGVIVERLAFAAWGLQEGIWRTGLTRVDTFLNAYNPMRMTRRPMTWSPDGRRFARRVGA